MLAVRTDSWLFRLVAAKAPEIRLDDGQVDAIMEGARHGCELCGYLDSLIDEDPSGYFLERGDFSCLFGGVFLDEAA